MKIGNFGSFDPELKKRGIVGLSNTTKLDEEVWNEFNNNWDELAYKSEILIAEFSKKNLDESAEVPLSDIPPGAERNTIVKTRINQNFFRQSVLSAYNLKCCITGIETPQLLVASHIKPWSKCNNKTEKTNPTNGLCINNLHDKAFDLGFITITQDFKIKVSKKVFEDDKSKIINDWFYKISGKKIKIPERFLPGKSFIKYHNEEIFLN